MPPTSPAVKARRTRLKPAVYTGTFGPEQAERLLWRASFGPRPGDVDRLAGLGMTGAVDALLSPGPEERLGPEPSGAGAAALTPARDEVALFLWWFDRMVRSSSQLRERMALTWHDWFATQSTHVNDRLHMVGQTERLRKHALGRFPRLLQVMTTDPAMLIWQSGFVSKKDAPNENYAREMLELFTIGVEAEYSERDIREQARSLTGWTATQEGPRFVDFRFDPERHDTGRKSVFGRTGDFAWRDACKLAVEHPDHPRYFIRKLWSAFVPSDPDRLTRVALQRLYISGRGRIAPVVRAILLHPDFYEGPRMVKPPLALAAGGLRGRGRGVDTDGWWYSAAFAGQRAFSPPDVSGWDERRWMDTTRWTGRYAIAQSLCDPKGVFAQRASYPAAESPEDAVASAAAYWGDPVLSATTSAQLLAAARRLERVAGPASLVRADRQTALRLLVAMSPDYQTC